MRFVLLLSLLVCFSGLGAPFAKQFQYTQPSGTAILWGEGDDFSAVFETLDGYTVVFVPEERAYHYARISADGTALEPTGLLVGQANLRSVGLEPHLRINHQAAVRDARARREAWDKAVGVSERWANLKEARLQSGPQLTTPPSFKTVGVKCGLTILIDFEDEPGVFTRDEVNEFLNGDNYTRFGNNGSVKEYFTDVSNSRLTFTNVVTPYITIPNSVHPRSYYNDPTKDCGEMGNYLIRDALAVMKTLPNYTNDFLPLFAAVTVDGQKRAVSANFFIAGMHSGVWAKGIWPHSWVLSAVVGPIPLSQGGKIVNNYQLTTMADKLEIMVFCHENGHLLCGFPDLYDYDNDSVSGTGPLCLMGGGQAWSTNPSQVCAYLKAAAGWADVVDLPLGTNFIASLSSSGPDFNRFFRLRKPGVPTEYFLVENRQKAGRDAEIPCSGIAVWHIDELGNQNNQSLRTNAVHQNLEIILEQADNAWDLQYAHNVGDADDLFFAENASPGYANAFSDLTFPSAYWWNGTRSGLVLSDFSTNGETMTFRAKLDPVTIRVDPIDITVIEGQPAAFGFFLATAIPSLTIQWYKDGVALTDSSNASGVNTRILRIASATQSDAGEYWATLTYPAGSISTRIARLTVTGSTLFSISYGVGTTTLVPDGVDVTTTLPGFGGPSDSIRFVGQSIAGDFDARVRVLGISMKGVLTRAGLTVRKAQGPSEPQVSVLNGFTPDGMRTTVLSRFTSPGFNQELVSLLSPYNPINPDTADTGESWLRIKRESDRVTCYRSENGSDWVWLKSVECDLGEAPLLGVVLGAGSGATEAASAAFRNYEVLTNASGTVAIFSPDFIAREGSLDDAHLAVHLSRNGPLEVQVNLAGTAVAGTDYLAPTKVIIPEGTNVGVLTISAINNTSAGVPKRVEVSLADQPVLERVQPTNAAALILDDEQINGLSRQVYQKIDGVAVVELARQLTNDAAMTDVDFVTSFEVDTSTNLLRYGQVLTGYLVPPETGEYVLYLASDDNSELWMSTDESAENLRRVAKVSGFTLFRSYSGSGNNSEPIPLQAGKYYYVKALHKQNYGSGWLSVAWQLPGGPAPANGSEPIGSQYLAHSLPIASAVQIAFSSGHSLELGGQTAGAAECVLEVSSDLSSWASLWTNTLPAKLELNVVDPPSGDKTTRFYRAVMR